MSRKIQKKAMKAFITDPEKTAIISAGEYIVISRGNTGVHIKKEEALIRYEDRIAIDKNTGEIHEDLNSLPETLITTSYPAALTNRLGYTEEHKIARKLVATDSSGSEISSYVLLEDLKYFGGDVAYRLSGIKELVVVVENIANPEGVGMILTQHVDEAEEEVDYE